jgi:hypothetical protein
MKYIGLLSSAASGKLGGIVASHNRNGTYLRHHAIPVQPRTPAQRQVRNQLAGFSSAFKSLSAANVAGWNALAATITLKSKLGTTYNPTGQQLFVSCNKHLAEIGITTMLLTAPTVPTIPAITAFSVADVGTISSPAQVTSMAASISPALPANFGLVIRATSCMTTGRTFAGKSLFRTIGYEGVASSFANDFYSYYTARFGALPQSGIIQVALKLVDPASGFAGPEVTANFQFYQPVGTNLFTLAVANQSGTTTSGSGTVTYSAEATGVGSFAGAVNYSVSGLPSGATWSYATNPKAVGTADVASIVCASVATGTYDITFTASYGTFSQSVTKTLTVA